MYILFGILLYNHPTLNVWWMWVLLVFFWGAKAVWSIKTRSDINEVVTWIKNHQIRHH